MIKKVSKLEDAEKLIERIWVMKKWANNIELELISAEVDSISVSGDFIIPGILADDDLSTLGTVEVAAADEIGVTITITPLNTLTLEGTVTVGSTEALLTFNAAPTSPEPEPNEEPEEPEEEL